jgi:hypothetical protein
MATMGIDLRGYADPPEWNDEVSGHASVWPWSVHDCGDYQNAERAPNGRSNAGLCSSLTLKTSTASVVAMGPRPSRYLVLALTLLLLLGHVCELPIEALVDWHVHEVGHESTGRHSHGHQTDESEISCDPVAGIARNGAVRSDCGLAESAERPSLARAVAVHVVSAARHESHGLSRRQPLFLLHSSLLI